MKTQNKPHRDIKHNKKLSELCAYVLKNNDIKKYRNSKQTT